MQNLAVSALRASISVISDRIDKRQTDWGKNVQNLSFCPIFLPLPAQRLNKGAGRTLLRLREQSFSLAKLRLVRRTKTLSVERRFFPAGEIKGQVF